MIYESLAQHLMKRNKNDTYFASRIKQIYASISVYTNIYHLENHTKVVMSLAPEYQHIFVLKGVIINLFSCHCYFVDDDYLLFIVWHASPHSLNGWSIWVPQYLVNAWRAGPGFISEFNLLITVPANGLAPKVDRPSAGTALTTNML